MNLLADSSAWLALYDVRDKHHSLAEAAFKDLGQQKVKFIVTDLIWVETVTLLRYRGSHQQAVFSGDWLRFAPSVRFIKIDDELWGEAWKLFRRYSDKDFSFADCASFGVMRQLDLDTAFTFDQHFKQMGFKLWPR